MGSPKAHCIALIARWRVPNGPSIGVRRWGASGATDVVLIHGLAQSSAHYEALGTELGRCYNVVALDLRGHGVSDRVPGTYQLVNYAADVAAFLETLANKVALVGHSLGGAASVYLGGLRPDLVRGVFAEDPPLYHGQPGVFVATPLPPVFTSLRDSMRDLQARDANELEVRGYLAQLYAPGGGKWVDEVTAADVDSRAESLMMCDPSVWDPAIVGNAISGWDPEQQISVPVTILRADPRKGAALTPDESAAYQRAVPHAVIVEVIGAPHGIREHVGSSSIYSTELERFLTSVGAGVA